MRQLTPAVATLADTLCTLGADDPEAIAVAIHNGECLRCLTGDDAFPCAGLPTIEQQVLAKAFVLGLALLAIQSAHHVN